MKQQPTTSIRARVALGLGALLLFLGGAESRAHSPRAPQGLKGLWTFAEGAGTSAADSSGSGYTGTLTNGPVWAGGKVGAGLSLDGTNDFVNLGASLGILQSAPAATLAAWIKIGTLPASGASMEIISISKNAGAPTSSSRAHLKIVGTPSGAQVSGGGRSTDSEALLETQETAVSLSAGIWTHVAVVLDFSGKTNKVFVNGSLAASATASYTSNATPNTSSTSNALGAEDDGSAGFFKGVLDEARIYNRALSAGEIATLAGGDELAARWTLDEGTGTTAGDASGNNYPGLLVNGPFWTAGGQLGNAVTFDGVNDFVALGSNLNLLRNINASTVMAWINPSSVIPSGATRQLVSISVGAASATDNSRVVMALRGDGSSGGTLYAGGRSTDTEPIKLVNSTTPIPVGAWSHVAATVDYAAKRITLFVNGVQVASGAVDFAQTHSTNSASADAALAAEDTGGSGYFAGRLDEVRVYARPLCGCEIQELVGKDGLRGHWKLDDAAGLVAADSSGNGYTGALVNAPTWSAGQIGGALTFNGSNQSVSLGSGLGILQDVPAATLASWIKITTLPASGASMELISISKNTGTTPTSSSRAHLKIVGTASGAQVSGGGRSTDTEALLETQETAVSLQAGSWAHVAVVLDYSAKLNKVYVNGALAITAAANYASNRTPTTPSTSNALGSEDDGSAGFFNGAMDDARIYCRALSAAEIQSLAAATPAAPANLVATAGNQSVSLSWSASSGATSYIVSRSLTQGGPYSSIGMTNAVTFLDTGLVNGTPYYYVVQAENSIGISAASNEASATPSAPGQPPGKPVILTASKKTNDVTPVLVGTADPNVTIKLFFGTTQESATTTSDFQGNWSLEASTKADAGYSVTAKASNTFGDSVASDARSITVDTHVNPPTNMVATSMNTQVHLTWTASPDSDVIGYEVYRSTGGGGFAKIHSGVVVGTFYCDSNPPLTNGIQYCYRIRAVDNTLQEAP